MPTSERFCVYVDWIATRQDDAALAQVGTSVIPDDAESETCIYWDDERAGVLVLTWNLRATDEKQAESIAVKAVQEAVAPLLPGRVGDVTVYSDDAE